MTIDEMRVNMELLADDNGDTIVLHVNRVYHDSIEVIAPDGNVYQVHEDEFAALNIRPCDNNPYLYSDVLF